jgi:hypothetical protein
MFPVGNVGQKETERRTEAMWGMGPRGAVRQLEFSAALRPSESQSRRTSSAAVRTGWVPR